MAKKGKKKTNYRKPSIKKQKKIRIIKWTSLVVLILVAIILFLLSPVFNIKEIKVNNNSKISTEDIIKLSGMEINSNMFKFLKFKTADKIMNNPYIETVKIKRHLNGVIEINIKERVATFLIQKEEQFIYLNNQGYILEVNSEKPELPVVEGLETEDFTPGNRLIFSDLKKLNTIIQIMKSAGGNNIADKITNINVESDQDYIIKMDTEMKIIHLGNSSKIDDKIMKIIPVLEDNIGASGQIFVQDINKVYFRSDV